MDDGARAARYSDLNRDLCHMLGSLSYREGQERYRIRIRNSKDTMIYGTCKTAAKGNGNMRGYAKLNRGRNYHYYACSICIVCRPNLYFKEFQVAEIVQESFAQMVRNQVHGHPEMESESHQRIRLTLWRCMYKLSLNSQSMSCHYRSHWDRKKAVAWNLVPWRSSFNFRANWYA